jgi:uncharacterized membrane protein YdjX (TVP38/TMEM64 family)
MHKKNHAASAVSRPLLLGLLALIIAVATMMFFAGHQAEAWLTASADRLEEFKAYIGAHGTMAVVLYTIGYIAFVSVSVPGAIWLSVCAGFLFGFWIGFGVAMIGGGVGATLAYILGHYVFTRWTGIRAAKHYGIIKKGFARHAFNYLLILRLMPGLPFVVVNLAVAAIEVRLLTYIAATFIGMAPSTAAHVAIGGGVSEVVAKRGPIRAADLEMNPTIALVLVLLALMAAMPIAYRHFAAKRKN